MIDEINGLSISQLTQSKIQEAFDEVALNKLIENQTSEREKARLLSLSLPQTEAWLSAAPIPALGLHLFRAAVKYRIGAPIYEKEMKCPYCKTGSLDTLGDHAVACHGRDDMISRHDRLRDKIFSACSAANLSPVCGEKNLIPETISRPGDVYLRCWSAGQPAALDITITSPLQPNIISNAARKSGFALRAAEDRKLEQYSQQCANIGVQFVPMAFESFGGLSELVRKTLKRIALLTDNRSLYSAGLSVAFSRLAQSVSVTLMRGNAIILIARNAEL